MKKKIVFFLVFILVVGFINVLEVQAVPNNNPALKELTSNIGELNPKFDYLTIEYSIVVPENIDKIEITAIPQEETSTVKITGNDMLVTGINTVEILVTAEDGTTRTYIIYVTKGDVTKTNTNLKEIKIENFKLIPEFSNDKTEYVLPISKETTLVNITALAENEKAKVEIVGNEKITGNDQLIKIVVTAEDNITKKQFNIIATKGEIEEEKEYEQIEQEIVEEQNESFWFKKYVLFSILLVIILIVVLRITQIKRAKQDKKKENQNV